MEVGFIGLGRMGQAMARNLLKAGHRVFVFNRTRSRAEELRDEGAEVADSPAGACKGDILITMLADDDAVEEIVLGSGGVLGVFEGLCGRGALQGAQAEEVGEGDDDGSLAAEVNDLVGGRHRTVGGVNRPTGSADIAGPLPSPVPRLDPSRDPG